MPCSVIRALSYHLYSLVPPDSTPEESSYSQELEVPRRPEALREVSGEEALLAHIKESSEEVTGTPNPGPILLGEHAIVSSGRSIAEVMHSDTDHTVSSKSSMHFESEGEEKATGSTPQTDSNAGADTEDSSRSTDPVDDNQAPPANGEAE